MLFVYSVAPVFRIPNDLVSKLTGSIRFRSEFVQLEFKIKVLLSPHFRGTLKGSCCTCITNGVFLRNQ